MPQSLFAEFIDRVMPPGSVSEGTCILSFDNELRPSAIGRGVTDVKIMMRTMEDGVVNQHVLSVSPFRDRYLSEFPQKWQKKRDQLMSEYRIRTCGAVLQGRPTKTSLSEKLFQFITIGTSYEVKPKM